MSGHGLRDAQPPLTANHFLAALPRADCERLAAGMALVHLEALEVIAPPGAPPAHAYFPLSGIISVVTIDAGGGIVEVGTIGREGVSGLHAFLGAPASPFQTMGQVPGLHARLPIGELLAAAVPGTALHASLLRYAWSYAVLGGQSAGCNRLHPLGERCARWLLMTRDGLGADTFRLTHEVLGQMLGMRRASVTLALGALQRAGLIRYHRGTVTILDHAGLEAATCECYGIITAAFAWQGAAPTAASR